MNFEVNITEKKQEPKQDDVGPFDIFVYIVFMVVIAMICR